MFAPEQNTRFFALVMTTAPTSGCSKADALHDVVQLDVDAQVVRVELQLVAGPDPNVLGHVHRDRRDAIRVRHAPVFIGRRIDLVIDQLSCANHVRSNAARSRSL
jgi:hypothetical protein